MFKGRAWTGFFTGMNLCFSVFNLISGNLWVAGIGFIGFAAGVSSWVYGPQPEDECQVCNGPLDYCADCGERTGNLVYIDHIPFCKACAWEEIGDEVAEGEALGR